MSKIGVIDVGGGCRGAYAAGVFDYFMQNNITFDLGIGVSAGSANLASFIAKQPQRNYQFYTEYALRAEYMGMGNFIKKKSFVGLDYIYGTLSNSDGALADPVPLDKAFEMGCDKIVLILTLPVGTERNAKQDKFLANCIRKNYPLAADKLEHRAELYNSCIVQARKYQRDGKLLVISPDDTCGVSTLSRNQNNLISLYHKGYKDGEKINLFL